MTTAFKQEVSTYKDFVPKGLPSIHVTCNESESPSIRRSYHNNMNPFQTSTNMSSAGFGDFSSKMLSVATSQQPNLNCRANSYNQAVHQPPTPSFHQSISMDEGTSFTSQAHYSNQGYVAPQQPAFNQMTGNQMHEVKLQFGANGQKSSTQNFHQTRGGFYHSTSFDVPSDQSKRRNFASQKNVFSMANVGKMPMPLPLSKAQGVFDDSSSPMTKCTSNSSYEGNSPFGSDSEGVDFDNFGFESPVASVSACKHSRPSTMTPCASQSKHSCAASAKMENGWKKKVKTELCKFWLNGQPCENSQKDQGCGFAHGQEELQKKKGLSRQYLTSVCKNFLEHPSKCTYGQRCIFQHPTYDVRKRQNYKAMMQDNARYTAMRLFQDIEGSEVIYINTYAATTPRLNAFKQICNSAKDNGDDYMDPEEEAEAYEFSKQCFNNRDLFRAEKAN